MSFLLSIRDEIVFSTSDGYLQRLPWKGKSMDLAHKISIYDISLSADLQHSRATRMSERDEYITQFDHSLFLRGYSLVLSTGRAAFVFSLASQNDNNHRGIWARELTDAVCVDINHRYRLLAFGCARFPKAGSHLYPSPVRSMEWGIEGYHLWIVCDCFSDDDNSSAEDENSKEGGISTQLIQMQFVKSTLTVNPCMERDLVVSGGLTWWKDFICLACYNLLTRRDEIRCYPRASKLDNMFACVTKVPSHVLLLNTFRDILIVFCTDCHIIMYKLERKNTNPYPTLTMTKVQENSLQNFVPHPLFVTGITLTSLRAESGKII
ncbi:RIC1 [Acanthosepion pharaonis]|uniref:RIC1 n=1 Tax=Acanthosepion pharaonis TaxID=158019 RepID=A0A812ENH8_ACAPH|nr:RIC1 [Sepia pharaonis]